MVELTDHPDMTIVVEWDVKSQKKNKVNVGSLSHLVNYVL